MVLCTVWSDFVEKSLALYCAQPATVSSPSDTPSEA
jgi:hypothetical protein